MLVPGRHSRMVVKTTLKKRAYFEELSRLTDFVHNACESREVGRRKKEINLPSLR